MNPVWDDSTAENCSNKSMEEHLAGLRAAPLSAEDLALQNFDLAQKQARRLGLSPLPPRPKASNSSGRHSKRLWQKHLPTKSWWNRRQGQLRPRWSPPQLVSLPCEVSQVPT